MTPDPDTATSTTPPADPPLSLVGNASRKGRRRGFVVGVCVTAIPVILLHVPLVQDYLVTFDDRDLGEKVHVEPPTQDGLTRQELFDAQAAWSGRCSTLALAIYGRHIPALTNEAFEGWASPAEKAFYAGCLGVSGFGGD